MNMSEIYRLLCIVIYTIRTLITWDRLQHLQPNCRKSLQFYVPLKKVDSKQVRISSAFLQIDGPSHPPLQKGSQFSTWGIVQNGKNSK